MDPNLEKIRDYHMDAIKAGKIAKPIFEAKNYLHNILSTKQQEVAQLQAELSAELDAFADHIKEIRDGKEEQLN
jgi:hypothetical protein